MALFDKLDAKIDAVFDEIIRLLRQRVSKLIISSTDSSAAICPSYISSTAYSTTCSADMCLANATGASSAANICTYPCACSRSILSFITDLRTHRRGRAEPDLQATEEYQADRAQAWCCKKMPTSQTPSFEKCIGWSPQFGGINMRFSRTKIWMHGIPLC